MVLTIITVVSAIGFTSIRAARDGYTFYTTGYTISAKLDQARTDALKRNQPVWLLIDTQAQSLQLQTTTGGVTTNVGAPEFFSKDMQVQVVGMATTTPQVGFDAIGRPSAGPQTIHAQHVRSGQTRTITVASTGRITVQ
jgi:Tfp pilus assembly protein FimT